MRALITGGAGFIGSHLAERLVELDHEVIAVDDLSTGRRDNIAHLVEDGAVELVHGSILDRELMDRLISRADTVFHLAAAVGVKLIVDNPLVGLLTNIHGTEQVLDSAWRHGARVLLASTSEIYGKNTADALSENDDRILGSPLKSRWSYSEAKAIDESLAFTYWRERGLAAVIVRLFNTVGPRQTGRYGMVIPRFVDQALRGEPITVYGDGKQTRCFCYVGDVVGALVEIVDRPEAYGQAFNIGRPDEVSIQELAERVIALTGSASPIRYIAYEDAYGEGFEDMERRMPDITGIQGLIGFDP
ncbi:MAG: NAD-dependent epimerase/dehydratase family protein, partial [Nitriliruptorales bacterium]|nr:NAD-dependent epimerase/dehydratase family protein [Nitriliruptorales bacterium]